MEHIPIRVLQLFSFLMFSLGPKCPRGKSLPLILSRKRENAFFLFDSTNKQGTVCKEFFHVLAAPLVHNPISSTAFTDLSITPFLRLSVSCFQGLCELDNFFTRTKGKVVILKLPVLLFYRKWNLLHSACIKHLNKQKALFTVLSCSTQLEKCSC